MTLLKKILPKVEIEDGRMLYFENEFRRQIGQCADTVLEKSKNIGIP